MDHSQGHSQDQNDLKTNHGFVFWFHLFITLLAWVAPLLFWWPLVCAIYAIIFAQFIVFGRCLLNAKHELSDAHDSTFYAYLLEYCGINFDRSALKHFVHRYLYVILGIIAWFWQFYLGNKAILF
jgi:hypothetical protein